MNMKTRITGARGFSLVELLVVIAIIALLLAALLPAMGAIKNKAKVAECKSIFGALDTGIQSYRSEQAIGASLPPSTGDNTAGDRREIAMPPPLKSTTPVQVSGAHLLVLALMGDGLGTAGFKNVPGSTSPGWWDDTHKDDTSNGLYSLDPATGKEKHVRYGPYADDKLKARTKGLDELAAKGGIVGPGDPNVIPFIRSKLPVFLDSWDRPILYYKSNPGSNRMLAQGTSSGIYRQEDNSIITGCVDGAYTEEGLDFGAGKDENFGGTYHAIAKAKGPDPTMTVEQFETDTSYDYSFARFIFDSKNKTRPTPVQRDTYLLISAGPDAQYGTTDDITNWTRETD